MEGLAQFPSTRTRISLTYFVFLCFVLISETFQAPSNGLYGDKDNVLILSQSNFDEEIYHQDRAFIIEFYRSDCGSSKKFAPTWIKFAGDIKLWSAVVVPAAVDCFTSRKLCQEYDIETPPTVKHFWTQLDEDDLGVEVPHKSVDSLKHQLIDFLKQNAQEKKLPKLWPMILPIDGNTMDDLMKNEGLFYIVVEKAGSYTGMEVILDFSGTKARVFRMEDTSASQNFLLESVTNYPALVICSATDSGRSIETLYATNENSARKEFRSVIENKLGIILEPSSGGAQT